jgi:uncharacterized protein YjbJ (UPF0337 family)
MRSAQPPALAGETSGSIATAHIHSQAVTKTANSAPAYSAASLGHADCRGICGTRARRHQLTKEQVMNWDRVEGNWKQFKGKVKEQWGKLTDDQIDQIEGRREKLAGLLQEEYGIAADQAERDIDFWTSRLN